MVWSVVLGLAGMPTGAYGQFHARETEWPTYAADLAGTRYRPFDQINASNYNDLEVAWRLKTDNFGNRPEYKLEGTPLMVNGVLYTTAGSRRAAIAVDAATGELLWVHGEHEGKRGAAAPRQLSGRGLAYWSDGKEERIFYFTPGYRLVSLDAKTGARIPSFGKDGIVDLKLDDDQTILPDLDDRRDRAAFDADRGRRHGHRRRSLPGRLHPAAASATTRAMCEGLTCAPASDSGSSTPSRRKASSATIPG